MKELLLVRHGQSEHHVKGLTGGWTNTGLTELGRKQSLLTGHRLQSLIRTESVAFFSSDLDRAMETATIIGSIFGLSAGSEAALRDLNWGIVKDMTMEEERDYELEKTVPLVDWVPFPEAENRWILYQRISNFLDIVNTHTQEQILIVSHGNAIEECIYWWLELPLTLRATIAFDIDPCSITHLRVNDWEEKCIALLNSTDHLHSLTSTTLE